MANSLSVGSNTVFKISDAIKNSSPRSKYVPNTALSFLMLVMEWGAYLKARAELIVMENVNLITTADFFTPYSDQFGNIDVNWDVLISMKINKFLSATLNTTLKYDNDVKTFEDNGEKRGAKVQFKEILGIGVAYNF